jgi:PPOX class probable F420-dependent enzyme
MSLTERQRRFALAHRVARLATAGANGAPHVIPICFALEADRFYFVIDEKPKATRTGLERLRNLAENPRAAIVIDDYDDEWRHLAYLLVRGPAAAVSDAGEYARILAALRRRYPQYVAMPLALETNPMIRITAERVHYWSIDAARLPG